MTESFQEGQLATVQVQFSANEILAGALLAGTSYTTIPVSPLNAPVAVGDLIFLDQAPIDSVILTATEIAAINDMSISVQAFTPQQTFYQGANLSHYVDPSVVKVDYYPGRNSTLVPLTYVPSGSGVGVIYHRVYQVEEGEDVRLTSSCFFFTWSCRSLDMASALDTLMLA